jgi:hypothetical protein
MQTRAWRKRVVRHRRHPTPVPVNRTNGAVTSKGLRATDSTDRKARNVMTLSQPGANRGSRPETARDGLCWFQPLESLRDNEIQPMHDWKVKAWKLTTKA